MNELSPQMIYKRTQATAVPELNDVHDLIYVTLKELHRSLAVLNENPTFGSDVHNNHSSRALTALYVLQVSLDFDRGGEIATKISPMARNAGMFSRSFRCMRLERST